MIRLIIDLLRPTPVTRDHLGKLGGNPHFLPPHRNVANDAQHGIAPGSRYTIPSRKC